MRVLVFHGYLLRGTGSNVYNARLAVALAAQGHEVHLLCQERAPQQLPFVGRAGDWDGGALVVRELGDGPVTVYRPDLGGLLPVFVHDHYDGLRARTFVELTDAELDGYLERNVAAVAEVAALVAPDVALANHLVAGPAILARALGDAVPFALKVHGSDLEYAVRRDPGRYVPLAREGLARARTALVGSRHTADVLWDLLDDPGLPARTRLGPPGVDVEEFRPHCPAHAAEGVTALAARLREEARAAQDPRAADAAPARGAAPAEDAPADRGPAPGRGAAPAEDAPPSAFTRDPAEAAAGIGALVPLRDRHVAFVGKLIVSKGVDLLAAAWPLVLAQVPEARLVVVGFGAYRDAFDRLLAALAAGDLAAVRGMAEAGRAAEGGPPGPLRHLLAFLDELAGAPDRDVYLAAAGRLPERVVLTGRLEHDELAPLLAACEAQVVPSTFPEAFGMVAVEAAACGALPVSAAHSGLAEVSAILAAAIPPPARPWLAFDVGPRAVRDLADRLLAWLQAPEPLRAEVREGLVATARERFSWDGVARGVLAAALGRHDVLPPP